ncbi:MAG: AbrB/MazE/SpoVT family DNA-binding domain-containing protein [Steroidobacteraceae bacterium]
MDIRSEDFSMRLQISKWGNSLAVRLPAHYTRAAGIKEGDAVEAEIAPSGKITLTPQPHFDKAAFLRRIRRLRAAMPVTSSTVEANRSQERY